MAGKVVIYGDGGGIGSAEARIVSKTVTAFISPAATSESHRQ
jgi:hypothetical protein